MKLSIVTPVLNSHEVVRRQLLHYQMMELPDDVEIIFVDDGSDPPIVDTIGVRNLTIHATNDTRPWTWAVARNAGARIARGEYLLMCDLDYIIPKSAIEDTLELRQDRMNFRREFAILNESGHIVQGEAQVLEYGLSPQRLQDRGFKVSAHTNDFVMRKETYWKLGGYREDFIGRPYPQGEDRDFQKKWARAIAEGSVDRTEYRPLVYMFPNGKFCGDVDYNPFGLFHELSRK